MLTLLTLCLWTSVVSALPQGFVFPNSGGGTMRIGISGACQPIQACPFLLSLLKANRKGLDEFESCGFSENTRVPLYKCPDLVESTPLADRCLCREAVKCPEIMEQIRQRNRTALQTFQRCGFTEEGASQFCCPKDLRRVLEANNTVHVLTPESAVNVEESPKDMAEPALQCGFSDGLRIVGGNNVDDHAYPWAVALVYANPDTNTRLYLCGGTLISPNWVVTAAHCIDTKNGHSLTQVRLGHAVLSDPEGMDVPIKAIHIHPEFEVSPILMADIALLELEENVTFTSRIKPICLPQHFNASDFQDAEVAGWGLVDTVNTSDRMQTLAVSLNPRDECEAAYQAKLAWFEVNPSQICAKGEIGTDSCKGDSGGPLMHVDDRSQWSLIGITSFGTSKCDSTVPGVYTNVFEFLDWIQETSGAQVEM